MTIVVSFRERWRFTPLTVDTILRNTSGNFALWLLDSGMPDEVRIALQAWVDAGELKIVDVGEGRQPNDARALIVSELKSRFVVFIDNDVVVSPGWLERMVACAEETGAGIVCPLYLWGDGPESDLVHMAGGDLSLEQKDGGLRMAESHRHFRESAAGLAGELQREACDFGEFHCLMMRRDVYSAEGMFDPGIVTVHEHIHASLRAKELGYATWFEPEARINYLAFAPWQVGELRDFRSRWDLVVAERSLAGFASRWGLTDDESYRSSIRGFITTHVSRADLLDPRPRLGARRGQAMSPADLQQTFGGLEWLALSSGYSTGAVQILVQAYSVAMQLVDGFYRPCGRPFINHLAGTASVLLFYGCPIQIILAGLLHAVFEGGEAARAGRSGGLLEQFAKRSPGSGNGVRLAKLYTDRARLLEGVDLAGSGMSELSLDLASLYVLDAANDVDMYLSFEVAASGRTDVLSGKRLNDCRALLDYVGLPGLSDTLRIVREKGVRLPTVSFQGGRKRSFRLTRAQVA